MNLDLEGALLLTDELIEGYAQAAEENGAEVILGVPAPYLLSVHARLQGRPGFYLAAQNMHQAAKGAYTGELSATMLKAVGCSHVILGHSERRQYFGETNQALAAKVKAALDAGLVPIYCLGETLKERENNQTFDVLAKQLEEALFKLSAEEMEQVIVAYEPVWAIGTGRTASPDQAQEAHAYLRGRLSDQYGQEIANKVPILYGGSVNASNAVLLFACPDIDGGLVGGASLQAAEFLDIIGAFM